MFSRTERYSDKPVNPVAEDEIWKEVVRNEKKFVRNWDKDFSFLIDEYRKLEVELKECSVQKLPPPIDTRFLEFHPQYPVTTSRDIGWVSSRPEMKLETKGEYCKRVLSLHKRLGWPIEACP